ncbi:cation:dicarboxylate symporter family transporter [Corallincola platygyrae]|uniref:Cation:dicarboxylate symporter family transporter n=1 Tax=Corallincola platygyrae TaxID=1193278 RepID=A0ABW4XQ63_9GAMM
MTLSRFRLSLSTVILWALFFGFLTGIFFGEMVGWMSWIGNAVIMLMQMTILPYIVVSLIGGIGRLTKEHAKQMFSRASVVLLAIWLVGMIVILLTPLAFPHLESASFFSRSLITPQAEVDFLSIYIPSNPFQSMANGAIPAVVLFSISLGVTLISLKHKTSLLDSLGTLAEALSKLNGFLVKTLPISVFALTASASGTLTLEQFGSLQVYLVTYLVLSLVLTFWVFPHMLASISPFKTGEVLAVSRDAMVTAFTTGNVFVLLPVLVEGAKRLFRKNRMRQEDTDYMLEVLMPIAYSFPNVGKLTVLMFVLFAGWFNGKPIEATDMPLFSLSGIFSLFGSVNVAIPFMLDSFKLPADMFELFIVSNVLTGKFNSLVAAMQLLIFVLLAVAVIQNQAKLNLASIARFAVLGLGVSFIVLFGSRFVNGIFLGDDNRLGEQLSAMRVPDRVPEHVYAQIPKSYTGGEFALTNIEVIKKRGVLRVGYSPTNVPFSFFNRDGRLVGFDISLAHQLAKDLGVKVEFIPFVRDNLRLPLNRGYFDVAMSGIKLDVYDIQHMSFTTPVLELNLSIMASDYRLREFESMEKLREHEGFTLATVEHIRELDILQNQLPQIDTVALSSYDEFFQNPDDYDALLISAESGYAWSILYPRYGVVLPTQQGNQFATGYVVAKRNRDLLEFLNSWVTVKRNNGSIQRQYDFWILGGGAQDKSPRWSVIRDVLHWVE